MVDAWFQCASGASGDMLLGALLDAGASLDAVNTAITAVTDSGTEPVFVSTEAVRRAGMAALKAHVTAPESHHHRGWSDIQGLLNAAGPDLLPEVRARALDVFARIATAEATAHGISTDEVHFHEVGALDAIADVVGVCAAAHDLGLGYSGSRVAADTVIVGSGTVTTAHGTLGVPVPAVVRILSAARAPAAAGPTAREMCTPTGAALLASLVDDWQPMPPMQISVAGTGAGTADIDTSPNVLRVMIGQRLPTHHLEAGSPGRPPSTGSDAPVLLESNIDDLDPRLWPAVLDNLLRAGADDAWLTPILMKKGRPAHTLSALCPASTAGAVRSVMFRESSTIGIREIPVIKHALHRTEAVIDLDGNRVRAKLSWIGSELVNAQPEFEDLAAASAATGVPTKTLLRAALARLHAQLDN